MSYIAEVLQDDKVWLINENRRLVSMHTSITEARESCLRRFNCEPKVVDRRPQSSAAPRS